MAFSRREFLGTAVALGASLAWGGQAHASRLKWKERRDLYPEGVASGDPDAHSVILWTRRPFDDGKRHELTVEIAEDEAFKHVIAHAPAPVSAATDWTTRVLVGSLKPAQVYWYRFTDADGNGSRIGRTITAPLDSDTRAVNFAFVSCQDLNEGKLNAFRRMIFEDERAAPKDQLGFILHLGDFIYEVVQYTDEVKTRYDRIVYDVGRIPDGGKVGRFHFPLTLDGYRIIYKGYLADPDLQDARARWPFVAMWDNHEFSWQGRQSIQQAGGKSRPGQSIKVAANQAWWEYLPSRCKKVSGPSLEAFDAPVVKDVPIETWDDNGLGTEPNNLAAINSLIGYRAFRYGKHLDLLITDQHSYRGPDPFDDPKVGAFGPEFPGMMPEDAVRILDGGRAFNGGKPPDVVSFNGVQVPNPRKNAAPQTILGATQKAWFKERLRASKATWKIWGNSEGAIDERCDPQNLPAGMTKEAWPNTTYAAMPSGDYGSAYAERAEIYDLVRDEKITGFGIVSGDRHSFWAGYASAELPPGKFEPVGLSFVGASLSSAGPMEGTEYGTKKDDPLRALFLADRPGAAKPDWTYNLLVRHGVKACLEYAKSFDLKAAKALSNPELAPHLEFVDLGGHGYATVRLTGGEMRTEFVCIPRPIARSGTPDGGPLRYRVVHTAKLWAAGERPKLVQQLVEGDAGTSS
ncbi:MAG: alkaline phosphatase D family protein [Deltaproteobacteria bacterium]|nr:alkaline phosphatase D family protein [Deltaproteobacteria bacterium]